MSSFDYEITVVIPYLTRRAHLDQAVAAWRGQKYSGPYELVVADGSGSLEGLPGARILPCPRPRWNISHARNYAARRTCGDLLIFAPADVLPAPELLSWLAEQRDKAVFWTVAGVAEQAPRDVSIDGLIAVKRWANTRIRGFQEKMMEAPHGWGYDNRDYLIRVRTMVNSGGETGGEIPTTLAAALAHDDAARVEPYELKDSAATYAAHEAWAAAYSAEYGWKWKGNSGQNWGA